MILWRLHNVLIMLFAPLLLYIGYVTFTQYVIN